MRIVLVFTIALFAALATQPTQSALANDLIALKLAQATPPAPPSKPAPSAEAPSGPSMAPEVQQLQQFLEDHRKHLDQLGEDIKKGLQTEQQATDLFDRMIGSFKELIDRIGPDSDYRKRLDEIIKRSRQNAKDFATSQNPEVRKLVSKNNETATMTEKLLNDANTEYAHGLETIRKLEEGKELAVAQIKSDALREAANSAKEYLDVVRDAIKKMEDFNNRVKQGTPSS